MKIWNDDEVKNLFVEVEQCKQKNIALRLAFSNHAEKYKRKTNSVRNYYYKEVDNLSRDKKRCSSLCIDISKHEKSHFVTFEEKEEKGLVEKIENFTNQGMSVRSACLKISQGNLTEMTRIQNKYQNLKKKEERKKEVANDNIIHFRKQQKLLTESDINSLFMGLVKLIKKTAIEDFMEKTKQEKESSSFLLKKAFLDLNKKDKQISQLREEFQALKKENQDLVVKLNEIHKKQSLKNHLSKSGMQEVLEKQKRV